MKVSIITPVYNNVSTIADSIISIKKQTHKNLEHIIIDGQSSDGSLGVINSMGHYRMMVFSETDTGVYDAMNKGLNLASGDIIGFVHGDDFIAHEQVIERIVTAFEDPEIEAVYGNLDYVAKNDKSKILRYWNGSSFSMKNLRNGWMPAHPTLYIRSHVYERLGGFNTKFRISADYDFILRYFLETSSKTVFIPEVLYKMRTGGISNRCLKNILLKMYEDRCALTNNGVAVIPALLTKNLSKVMQFHAFKNVIQFTLFGSGPTKTIKFLLNKF